MVILDVLYVALATIAVMFVLQILTFLITRMMYPPEPRVIYRDAPVPQTVPQMHSQVYIPPPIQPQVLTQPPQQEVKLPEYEPRSQSISTSLRVDPELPTGLQETRPNGT
jgi:hypothetical protein